MSEKFFIDKDSKEELNILLANTSKVSLRSMLKMILHLRFCKKDVAFWPNALIAYAFSFDESCSAQIEKLISVWEKQDFTINRYDDILLAYVLMTKTDLLDKKQRQRVIDKVDYSLRMYDCEMIPYRNDNPDMIYADLLGMVPQFLINYGINEKKKKYIDWGMDQFRSFAKNANDPKTGLLYHAYNRSTGEKMGIIGWGRAMGWIMIGLSESLTLMTDEQRKEKKELMSLFERYLETINEYQRDDGGFSWQLQAMEGPFDSSATAMILQSMYLVDDKIGINEKYKQMMQRMMSRLDDCNKNGKVMNCSAECGGIGVYPQKYGSYSWSVAPYVICKALNSKNEKE